MARYRLKSAEELVWNAVRRAATARIRLEAAAWQEARLNEVLPALQMEFHRRLQAGDLPALEAEWKEWVTSAIEALSRPELEDDNAR